MKKIFSICAIMIAFAATAQTSIHKIYTVSADQSRYLVMTTSVNGDAYFAYQYQTGGAAYLAVQRVDALGNTVLAKAYQLLCLVIVGGGRLSILFLFRRLFFAPKVDPQ